MYVKDIFYSRELDRARTSPSFVNILIPLSPVKIPYVWPNKAIIRPNSGLIW